MKRSLPRSSGLSFAGALCFAAAGYFAGTQLDQQRRPDPVEAPRARLVWEQVLANPVADIPSISPNAPWPACQGYSGGLECHSLPQSAEHPIRISQIGLGTANQAWLLRLGNRRDGFYGFELAQSKITIDFELPDGEREVLSQREVSIPESLSERWNLVFTESALQLKLGDKSMLQVPLEYEYAGLRRAQEVRLIGNVTDDMFRDVFVNPTTEDTIALGTVADKSGVAAAAGSPQKTALRVSVTDGRDSRQGKPL